MMNRSEIWLGAGAVVTAVAIGAYLTARTAPSSAAADNKSPESVGPLADLVATNPALTAVKAGDPLAPSGPSANQVHKDLGASTNNLLPAMHFTGGSTILYQHEDTLRLRGSRGWVWGYVPKFDLVESPIMQVEFRTKGQGSVWLEIKNSADDGLVGKYRYGMRKFEMEFPDTRGVLQRSQIDFRRELTQSARTDVRTIAFSDPTEDVEIVSIRFLKAGEEIGNKEEQ